MLVVGELDLLGVDQDQADVVRRGAQEDRGRTTFTLPDLPEPVVPAIRRCGIRARSVHTELPEMSLPSQTERAGGCREVVEDIAERDEVR